MQVPPFSNLLRDVGESARVTTGNTERLGRHVSGTKQKGGIGPKLSAGRIKVGYGIQMWKREYLAHGGQDNSTITAARARSLGLIVGRQSAQSKAQAKAKPQKAKPYRKMASGFGKKGGVQGFILFKNLTQQEFKKKGLNASGHDTLVNAQVLALWKGLPDETKQLFNNLAAKKKAKQNAHSASSGSCKPALADRLWESKLFGAADDSFPCSEKALESEARKWAGSGHRGGFIAPGRECFKEICKKMIVVQGPKRKHPTTSRTCQWSHFGLCHVPNLLQDHCKGPPPEGQEQMHCICREPFESCSNEARGLPQGIWRTSCDLTSWISSPKSLTH